MPDNDDQLQQQYQEILNKYATSINQPGEITESKIIPETITTAIDVTKSIVTGEPVTSPIYSTPKSTSETQFNFFKYLFYFSLIVFIGVISAIIYTFLNSQQPHVDTQSLVPTATPTISSQFCELGDRQIPVGESFLSADSCNSCSCTPKLTITCTEKVCISPTAKPSLKPVSQKIYKDIKYGYQFSCPTTAKYVIEATSVNGNKIPFKQESCTLADSSVIISVYDNTLVHNFGNLQTKVTLNKKYIFTLEGDNDDIVSSFKLL